MCSESTSNSGILCAIEDAIADFLEPIIENAMEGAGVEVVPEGQRDPDGIYDKVAPDNSAGEEAGGSCQIKRPVIGFGSTLCG
jgi:hypothetical protein